MQLNTNYDDLYRQIKNIEEHFIDCTSANSCAAYYAVYQTLIQLYSWSTYKNLCNKKVSRNSYVHFFGRQQVQSLGKKRLEDFISNQNSHLSFISSIFFDFTDIVNDFIDSDFYGSVFWKNKPIISDSEEQDILYSFFDECCPNMHELFDSYKERGKFYRLQSSLFFNRDGCTFYNPIENDSDIFCHSKIHSLRLMSLIVHELSHADDFSRYSLYASPVNVFLYQKQSSFCEVPAYYNQFRFYEYLLKNGIYPDTVFTELIGELTSLAECMNNLLMVSLLSSKSLKKQQSFFSRNQILQEILENSEENSSIELNDSEKTKDTIFSLDNAIQYSYGPLLAIAMMDDEALYRKFSMIRGDYFDKDKLSSIGLSQENVSKKVMKKCDDFFGKYL